jgi:hypothetical protein
MMTTKLFQRVVLVKRPHLSNLLGCVIFQGAVASGKHSYPRFVII